jgi:hypothetical protein
LLYYKSTNHSVCLQNKFRGAFKVVKIFLKHSVLAVAIMNILKILFYQRKIQRADVQYKEDFDIVSGNETKRPENPR